MPDSDEQRRILAVTVQGIRVVNIYVPNGESVESAKYQYKLNWLANLKNYLKKSLVQYPKLVLLGDFNIAPKIKTSMSLIYGEIKFYSARLKKLL